MKCPKCNHGAQKVIDSRESQLFIRRRRVCLKCDHRFTTYEVHSDSLEKAEELIEKMVGFLPALENTLAVAREFGQIERFQFKPGVGKAAPSYQAKMRKKKSARATV